VNRIAIVTGGSGFIGSYLTRRLVRDGWHVRVIDTHLRGRRTRLADLEKHIEIIETDVRDEAAVCSAMRGADVTFHLAAINGTENFYNRPDLVLDVGIRGALAVVNGCVRAEVPDLVVASSAEVYQTPTQIPTPEPVPVMLPDTLNPRFSYGGSKIASELIAFNYGREHFRKVQVFRPHNVYGPDMGWKHVIPQLIARALPLSVSGSRAAIPIQGDGTETRSFCFVDDVVDGILTMYERGEHRNIYHIGNDHEISIRELVTRIGRCLGVGLTCLPQATPAGSTPRRCPDISKIRSLGYDPKTNIDAGLTRTITWYAANPHEPSHGELI
jgi:UDP-glucose 4-epimerase